MKKLFNLVALLIAFPLWVFYQAVKDKPDLDAGDWALGIACLCLTGIWMMAIFILVGLML